MSSSRKRQQSREEATGTRRLHQTEDDPSIISIHGASITMIALNWANLQASKQLATIREGKLPSVQTTKILEGGETCHFDKICTFTYNTTNNLVFLDGELVVTNKRIIFMSPARNLELSPSKIVNIDFNRYRTALEIKVSSGRGGGAYRVQDCAKLEAILCGVVRKHKYLLAESYSSSKTRHIPGDVKRAVWDRDGGRCVECGATDYLEFDHIIPHSRGGANTANNLQLLCRRCNAMWKDRI